MKSGEKLCRLIGKKFKRNFRKKISEKLGHLGKKFCGSNPGKEGTLKPSKENLGRIYGRSPARKSKTNVGKRSGRNPWKNFYKNLVNILRESAGMLSRKTWRYFEQILEGFPGKTHAEILGETIVEISKTTLNNPERIPIYGSKYVKKKFIGWTPGRTGESQKNTMTNL